MRANPTTVVSLRMPRALHKRITTTYGGPRSTASAAFTSALEAALQSPSICALFERALSGLYEESDAKRAKLRYQLEKELRALVFKAPGVPR